MNVHEPDPSTEKILKDMTTKPIQQYSLTNSSINLLLKKRPLILKTLKNQLGSFLYQWEVNL